MFRLLLTLALGCTGTAQAADQSLFSVQTPAAVGLRDGVNYELGMKFTATAAGLIKGIRFYKSPGETGTHTGKIYSSSGVLLASVVFSNETASGWQTQSLATPYAIAANTQYTVSVNTGNQYYVATNNGLATQISSANLRNVVGANGVYGPVGSRPTQSWLNSNYFRDVVFEANATAPPAQQGWQNLAFAAQSGNFTAQFDAIPSLSTQDAVVGLSKSIASQFNDLAAMVRFGVGGRIDVRNGGAYASLATVSNVAGRSYRVRMVVNMSARTYSVYVTPQGQAEVLLAQNYAFRSSQASVTSLANRAQFNAVGGVAVSGFSVLGSVNPPPPPTDTTAPSVPMNLLASATSSSQINLSWSASSDNVGVSQYRIERCQGSACTNFAQIAAQSGLNYANANLSENTAYRFRVRAQDAAGNLSAYSVIASATTATSTPPVQNTWPNASNTGVPDGTVLTNYTGPMTITQNGTVIDSKIINGTLRVTASNVVIKNSRVQNFSGWGIDGDGASNLTVQDCDLVGRGSASRVDSAILGSGNFLRNDISQTENGISLQGGASVVKGNFIHDLAAPGSDPHYDGLQVYGGQDGVLIEDNTILADDTSEIFLANLWGPLKNITINHNFCSGADINIRVEGNKGPYEVSGISITNNYLAEGHWGHFNIVNASVFMQGNVLLPGGSLP